VEGQTAPDYYQLLANLALVGTAKNHLEVSGENLRLTETKLRAGAATRLEVDRATADVEAQVQQLASANLQVALVARDLESTTSIAPDISSAPELTDDLHPEPDLSSRGCHGHAGGTAAGHLPEAGASAHHRRQLHRVQHQRAWLRTVPLVLAGGRDGELDLRSDERGEHPQLRCRRHGDPGGRGEDAAGGW
jgi:hypothetical protein